MVKALAALAMLFFFQAQGVDYKAAFEQGLEAYEHGDYAGAAQRWERLLESIGQERGYKVCYNLGLAYQKLGDPTRAIERLETFARRAALEPTRDDELEQRRQDALERVKAIESTHGALRVAPAPPGQVVLVRVGAGEPRPAGFTLWLAPGAHEVELYAGTTKARKKRVVLVAGQEADIALDAEPAPPPPNPRDAQKPKASFPTAWLVGGAAVTLASCALPLVFALDTKSKRDDALSLGPGSNGYADAAQKFEDARSRYEISWAVPATLAVATAAIVVVQLLTSDSSSDHARTWPLGAF